MLHSFPHLPLSRGHFPKPQQPSRSLRNFTAAVWGRERPFSSPRPAPIYVAAAWGRTRWVQGGGGYILHTWMHGGWWSRHWPPVETRLYVIMELKVMIRTFSPSTKQNDYVTAPSQETGTVLFSCSVASNVTCRQETTLLFSLWNKCHFYEKFKLMAAVWWKEYKSCSCWTALLHYISELTLDLLFLSTF